MRYQIALMLMMIGVGVGVVLAVPAVPANEQTKIQELIGQLGSDNFRQRDAATKELDAIGEPALSALRKAAKNSDMEIANRAAALIAKIEQRGETARLIAPTYVELTFKETPIEEAVATLARKSGYSIAIGGDKSKMTDRRVTLETGKVPFWKALEMLCEKAGLVESDGSVVVQGDTPSGKPVPAPVQIRPLPAQIKPIQLKPALIKPIQQLPPQIEKEEKPVEPKPAVKPNLPQGFSADDKAEEAKKAEEARRLADLEAKKKAEAAEAAKRAQLQAQAQIQVQPARPIGRVINGRPAQPNMGNTIVLVDGKSDLPSSTESAVRVRAITNAHPQYNQESVPDNELAIVLEVRAEPKLQLQQVLGVKIDKAIDNYDQLLSQMVIASPTEPMANEQLQQQQLKLRVLQVQGMPAVSSGYIAAPFAPTTIPVRLKKSDKQSKMIKELRGEVSLKIRTPAEEVVAINNILKAKGELMKGKGNSSLKIIDVEKAANGDIKIVVELQYSNEIAPAGNGVSNQQIFQLNGAIQIQGQIQIQALPAIKQQGGIAAPTSAGYSGLEMVDDKGISIGVASVQNARSQFQQNGRTLTATITFRPKKDQEAAKLAFKGTRLATVDVPFLIKDVPLK